MRRVCFDIGSDWYKPIEAGWMSNPEDARGYFGDKKFKFHAATAYINDRRRYVGFTDYRKLYNCLVGADEIISFNGRICDLIVLESLVGKEAIETLWLKPHHDLQGWRNCQALKDAAWNLLKQPESAFKSIKEGRLKRMGITHQNAFIADHIADTYRDVKFTQDLFRLYLASGDTSCTFRDR